MGIEMLMAGMGFEIHSMLVLRRTGTSGIDENECLPSPEKLREGMIYPFKISGRGLFPQGRKEGKDIEIPLYERPDGQSTPEKLIVDSGYPIIADVNIITVTHQCDDEGRIHTSGIYKIIKLNKAG